MNSTDKVVLSAIGPLAHADDDVESVSGTAVDNTDPRNPIIGFTKCSASSCVRCCW